MNAASHPAPVLRGRLKLDEPMARHTTWRVGGCAARYYEPADRADLAAFVHSLPAEEPVLWVGLGSNLLVRDGGWPGTVIALHGALDALRLEGTSIVYAEAGVHCARLAKFAQQAGLAGLGFMAGIPGTVGGALAMNAGAWGGETWPCVIAAEVIHRDGRIERLEADRFRYAYRQVEMPAGVCGFMGAQFRVAADADGAHRRYTREALARRKATQPVGKPSAGSTFTNPPGDHAARLIEASGLKGHRIGGAHVSTQHANFVITDAGARAADVEALIAHIQQVVRDTTGVVLQTEVRIVGEPAGA